MTTSAMTPSRTPGSGESAAQTSGIDASAFSSVIAPTSDFYRYVNGPWIDAYALPADHARYGSFNKLSEDAEAQLREILEDPDAPCTLSRTVYDAFLDTAALEEAGISPIVDDLHAIDNAPSKAALHAVLGGLSVSGGPGMIGVAIYSDPGNAGTNVVHLFQGGLGLPDEGYYREERFAPVRSSYVSMVAQMLHLAGYAPSPAEAMDDARRFLAVETRIAANHWDNVSSRDEDKTYNPYDADRLLSELDGFDIDPWLDAWQKAYDASAAASAMPLDLRAVLSHTIVHQPSFITGIAAFWREATLDELKLWARVHELIGWSTYLNKAFDQAHFDFYGKTLHGTTEQRERWRRAVGLVDGVCGEDVGREYVRRHFPASSKKRVERLVANLIDAYRASIQASDWLGEETKGKALEKLDKFEPKIGYTNHWRDYSAFGVAEGDSLVDIMRAANRYENGYELSKAGTPVDKDEWLMTPQTVNAYYEPTLNVIVFPAAILQPPFFDPEAEDAANYGGIGAVIGHEIGHGFDDQGSKYDGDGRLHDWWTAQDRANFDQRTHALIEQYDSFVPLQLREKYEEEGRPDDAPHVNGALTIGENIGDLGGVNIALKAYALSLGATDGCLDSVRAALSHAPVMDGFTGLQRFFLSYAQIWRTKIRNELAEQFLQIDPHSPAEFRVNGIVRNVDLFHEAFGTAPGDAMWLDPDRRVRIW